MPSRDLGNFQVVVAINFIESKLRKSRWRNFDTVIRESEANFSQITYKVETLNRFHGYQLAFTIPSFADSLTANFNFDIFDEVLIVFTAGNFFY